MSLPWLQWRKLICEDRGPGLVSSCKTMVFTHGITHCWIEDSPVLDVQVQVYVFKMIIQISVANNVIMAFNAIFLGEIKVRT